MSIAVCHLTTVHQPDDVRIYQKEARSLAEAGYYTELIAPAKPGTTLSGVRLVTLPRPRNRFERFLKLVPTALKVALGSRARVCHLHDPELLFVGLLLKLGGKRVVWDVHEDLPRQILTKPWIPRGLRRVVAFLADLFERRLASLFDAVVAATPAIAERFSGAKRVLVVQNFPKLEEFARVEGEPYEKRPPWVAYVGGITPIRGAREMVAALAELPEELGAELVLAGSFDPPELEKELRGLPGWHRVRYLGWLDRPRVAELLGKVRAGLVLFHPVPNHRKAMPNKLFEYMAAGLPVIASDFSLWRKIVADEGVGLLVDPLDPKAIAGAIAWVLEHPDEARAMGERGRKAVLERYNWDREREKLLALYKELVR